MRRCAVCPSTKNQVRNLTIIAGLLVLSVTAAAQGTYTLTWSSTTHGGGQSTGSGGGHSYLLIGAAGNYTSVHVRSGAGAPNPNPMQWAIAPHAVDTPSISMTAAEATDANGAVLYYFQNVTVTDGSHDSGWQVGREYTDTGLAAGTRYQYKVKAKGGGGLGDETAYSSPMFARTEAAASETPEGSARPVSGELGNDLNLQVDPFTGSVGYTLPIAVPPGRQGSEPSIALRYGGGGNGWCGVGWSLGMGVIQRDTRKGVPVARSGSTYLNRYDDGKGFVVSFGAVNTRLVHISTQSGISEYRAETDQAFLKYELHHQANWWVVTDKSGNKFYFGFVEGEDDQGQYQYAGTAMVHPQFETGTGSDSTFMWGLSKIQDINGNLTYIYYSGNQGQPYLSEIRYNGHTADLPTTSSVQFLLDSTDRPDKSFSYATGYRVENNKRLRDIQVRVYDYETEDWAKVRRYHLDYNTSSSTLRSLLTSVTLYGASDVNSLPPVTFEYQVKPFEFESTVDWGPLDSYGSSDPNWNSPMSTDTDRSLRVIYFPTLPGTGEGVPVFIDSTEVGFCDLNGDALPDRVLQNNAGSAFTPPNNVLKFQINTGSGFRQLQDWGPIDAQGHTSSPVWNSPRATWADVFTGHRNAYVVEWNPPDPPVYAYDFDYGTATETAVDILDINGDGLADRVMRKSGYDFSPPNNNSFRVQFNNGNGFSDLVSWGPLYSYGLTTCSADSYGEDWDLRAKVFNSIDAAYNGNVQSTLACLVDMNHDGLPDRILYDHVTLGSFKVQFNSGNGFESDSGSPTVVSWGPVSGQGCAGAGWFSPRMIDGGQETTIDLLDINGDGLPDRVMRKLDNPFTVFVVQFNTGSGFEKDSSGNAILRDWGPLSGQDEASSAWNSLQGVVKETGTFYADLFDINGDGLPDRVMRERTGNEGGNQGEYDVFKVQLNTGRGFQEQGGTAVLVNWTGIDDQGGTNDWASPHGVIRPDNTDGYTFATVCDINGDGLPDRVMRKKNSTYSVFKVQLNKGPLPDLLSTVHGKLGGSVHVDYKSSTDPNAHKDANGVNRMPFSVQVASLVDVNDGFGNHMLTQYDYERGFYNADRREFAGFGLVTIEEVKEGQSGLEQAGTKTLMHFHQGGGYEDPDSSEWQDAGSVGKRGMPYRVEVYGNDGKLYGITTHKVVETEVAANTGWHFAYVAQTTTLEYPGITYTPGSHLYPWDSYRAKMQQWQYDTSTGNLVKSIDLGEIDLGITTADIAANLADHTYEFATWGAGDELYTHVTYATISGHPEILDKIASTKATSDEAGNTKLKETIFTYDSHGRVETEQTWLDVDPNGPRYTAESRYGYDACGNQSYSIDKAGIRTDMVYDSNYHMFPIESSTGTFVTSVDYDIRSGLPTRTIDPAGMVTESRSDEFFRVTDTLMSAQPNGTANVWLTHVDYNVGGISDGSSHNHVHQIHEGYEAYIYSDGLGRIVQTRVKAETGAVGEYRVVATSYNEIGKLSFQTVPFFSNGESYTSSTGQPGTLTEYEPIGRVWKVTPPEGETGSPTGYSETLYGPGAGGDPWELHFTDAEGKTTRKYLDAAGRVVSLKEFASPNGWIWTYHEYDRLGRLISTTDNSDNVIAVEYDSLDRKIRTIDPDMGTWTYAYDDAGRMTDQNDARGNKIHFTYEPNELGRVTQETVKNSADTLVETITYTYDESDDPDYTVHKGQLYKVTDGQGWTKTSYDSRGRATKSTRYLSETGQSYTTETAYDAADRVTELTYPDGRAVVAYSYDTAGHLVRAESLWGTGANEVFYQASGFNAADQVAQVTYGNGRTTQYEYYDVTKRLKRILTSGSSNIQDITYTFDSVSNIKGVTDTMHTGTQSCSLSSIQYDGLHRLVSLISTAENKTITYEYDGLGNVHKNGEMGTGAYTYSTKPHAVVNANGSTYSYDACGNMITRNRSGQLNQTLAYDEQNRLAQVAITDGSTVQFGYAADGSRLWKKVNGQITNLWIGSIYEEKGDANGVTQILCHVYAGDQLVVTFEPAGTYACLIQNNRYLAAIWNGSDWALTGLFGGGRAPLSGMALAIVIGLGLGLYYSRSRLWIIYGMSSPGASAPLYRRGSWRQVVLMSLVGSVLMTSMPLQVYAGTPVYDNPIFYYYHPDHLGSSQLMTDRDGDVVQQYGYSPFGRENYKNNALAFSISDRYTGQILDEETGLYYYGARYYDPELARFIQPDSIVPSAGTGQALNRYSYCLNSPLKLTDPTGNYPYDFSGMFEGAYMGAIEAGLSGGDAVMGAYIGAINGLAGTTIIPTTNSYSSVLSSCLSGNTSATSLGSGWTSYGSGYDYNTSYNSSYDEPADSAEPGTNWHYEPTSMVQYDYATPSYGATTVDLTDAGHTALDLAGILDPSPTADLTNAAWYASEGRWGDAGISSLGVIPYIGDLGKLGRLGTRMLHYAPNAAAVVQKGWRVGEPITNLTKSGSVPSWSAVRQRFWKNEAFYNAAEYSEENLARMRRGLAEQRTNPVTGELESRHLHHDPPQSEGGLFGFEKKWPDEHERIHYGG